MPGVVELAEASGVLIAGNSFKSGKRIKSVLVDSLISAGIKINSIVSYNHKGSNDNKLTHSTTKKTRSGIAETMANTNRILYAEGEKPDGVVIEKYVPTLGDSKRNMDEYTSEIFLGGRNTIIMHNTVDDSLIAVPMILDLVVLTELCQRIQMKVGDQTEFQAFQPVLSMLSYSLKTPEVPNGHVQTALM